MDNIKNDRYYIDQISEQIDLVEEHIANKTAEDLENNLMLKNAILFSIMQIGECAGKLTEGFRQKYDEIPWHKMRGMRNIIVHDYVGVDLMTVYKTAIEEIPKIKSKLIDCGIL